MIITFTTNQITEATGVLKRTVQHWITQEVLVPEQKASGSGSHNKFAWREVEICRLLGEVSKWRIHIDELKLLAGQMRDIITLGNNPELLDLAQKWVRDGGNGSFASGGGPVGQVLQATSKDVYVPTSEESARAWAHAAYQFGKQNGRPAFWEIWWDENNAVSVHARFISSETDEWNHVHISPHALKGRGIILDLSILAADT